jgi:hypothetical protein
MFEEGYTYGFMCYLVATSSALPMISCAFTYYLMCLSFVAHYYFMHEICCSLFHLVAMHYWAPYFMP